MSANSEDPSAGQPSVAASPQSRPPVARLKRFAQNAALFLGTFLLCGILLEIALRIAGYGNLEIYQPDPVLYWKLRPNQNCFTKVGHQAVRINSLGTRGPEFSPSKPPGTFRILSLGDSRTFGWGLAEDETYSARLAKSLSQSMPQASKPANIEVINAGVNAWSYAQLYVYFREFGLKYQPDVVVVGEANQWTQFSENNSPEFIRKFLFRVRLKNLLRRSATYHYIVELKLKDFYERHRTRFIPVDPKQDTLFKPQQQSDPDAAFRTAILNTCLLAKSNGIAPVLLFLPTEDELSLTNEPPILPIKRRISAELQVPLVDMRQAMAQNASTNRSLYLEADPVHLNSEGNALVARELTSAIAPMLNREQAGNH